MALVNHRDQLPGELHEAKRHKANVRAASTAAVTLASAVENGDSLDGVTLATGDRILLKDQSTGSQNGIYVVAASGSPTRATDADAAAELFRGFRVYVEEGSQAGTEWALTTTAAITLNTTALTFTQVGGAHTHAASDIASGTVATARLGSGTANSTTYLRGDQTWAVPAGGGGGGNTITVANATGSTIPKGSAVIWTLDVDGSGNVKVGKLTSGEATGYLGILTGALTSGGTAICQTSGVVTGLDTSAFAVLDLLYVDSVGDYQIYQTVPYVHLVGLVLTSHATTGTVLILRLPEGGDREPSHYHHATYDGGAFGEGGGPSLPVFEEVDFTTVSTPSAGKQVVGIDSNDGHLKRKDSTGTVTDLG